MFEKEAEEYLKKDGTKAEQILDILNETSPLKITLKQLPFILAMLQQIFKDGAEYGYNKGKGEQAYIAGAKENGIQWHDLRKNPDDLPEYETEVIAITESDGSLYRGFEYYEVEDSENNFDGWSTCQKIIAWAEIPEFKEE